MWVGTIRNNTALKRKPLNIGRADGFGTIRNNTALKLRLLFETISRWFWNHSKQHSSKTQQVLNNNKY